MYANLLTYKDKGSPAHIAVGETDEGVLISVRSKRKNSKASDLILTPELFECLLRELTGTWMNKKRQRRG